MSTRQEIYNEVELEVLSALNKLETIGINDDGNTRNDWIAFANAYIGRSAQDVWRNTDNPREMIIKAIGLLVRGTELGAFK